MPPIKLSKTFTQMDKQGFDESTLTITVEYDPKFVEVKRVVGISVYNFKTRQATDISYIMREQFEDQMNDMTDSIDWHAEHQEEKFFKVHDKDVVVHDSVSMIRSLQKHFT